MKEIVNHPGYYVTETGEVYSSKSGKYLAQATTKKGYKTVRLYTAHYFTKQVHRLVAKAFIPNPLNLPEVDHDDEDKTNNNVSNLQWITTQGNCEKAHAKHYIVENVASGERFEIYNVRKFCRENNLNQSNLIQTRNPTSKWGKHQSQGFRLISR